MSWSMGGVPARVYSREKNHRDSSTIDGHNCFQTRVGQCRCPDQAACTPETGKRHHRVPAGHHSLWRPVEGFASCADGNVVGRESLFRNGRRRSSLASGRGNGDTAALRVEPRRGGGRRGDCPDLRSVSAAHEICDSVESLDMVALCALLWFE